MAVRPDMKLNNDACELRTVETAQTVVQYRMVKGGNAEKECQHSGAGEVGIGIAIALGGNTAVTAGAAGDRVTVHALATDAVIPVVVGTGGATFDTPAKAAADGLTDATPSGSGTTLVFCPGFFTQTGVAGDIVGLRPAPHYITE